eukprot:gene15307-10768_t
MPMQQRAPSLKKLPPGQAGLPCFQEQAGFGRKDKPTDSSSQAQAPRRQSQAGGGGDGGFASDDESKRMSRVVGTTCSLLFVGLLIVAGVWVKRHALLGWSEDKSLPSVSFPAGTFKKNWRQWGGKRTSTKSSATRHRMEGLVETASDVPLDIEDPSLLSELVWDTAAELPGRGPPIQISSSSSSNNTDLDPAVVDANMHARALVPHHEMQTG